MFKKNKFTGMRILALILTLAMLMNMVVFAVPSLEELLSRIDEFDTFTAEERAFVLDFMGMSEQPSDDATVEYNLGIWEAYNAQPEFVNIMLAIVALDEQYQVFSGLPVEEVDKIHSLLKFDEAKYEIINEIFENLEADDYGILESAEIVRLMQDGIFNAPEIMSLLKSGMERLELYRAINEFKQFAKAFNIDSQVDENKLSMYNLFRETPKVSEELTSDSEYQIDYFTNNRIKINNISSSRTSKYPSDSLTEQIVLNRSWEKITNPTFSLVFLNPVTSTI